MGWQDRRYTSDGSGGFSAALRRVFGDGENPLTWSLPLYRAWGIGVRIHIFYVVYILIELVRSIPHDQLGPGPTAMAMASLFVLVLLHEYGHCIACRRVQGDADRIIMWPLGGLAFCSPPHRWQAHLITAIGGPAVNVILWPVLGAAVVLVTGSASTLLFNPFDLTPTLLELHLRSGDQPTWLVALWFAYFINIVLFAFNMLVPMYPMDAGRVAQAIMWRFMGYAKSMRIATVMGMVAAGVLAVIGITTNEMIFFAIAIFGGVTCWMEKRRLEFDSAGGVLDGYDFSRGYQGMPDDEPVPSPGRAQRRKAHKRQLDQAELDRILDKIAKEGMGKLTKRERRFLERESTRRKDV